MKLCSYIDNINPISARGSEMVRPASLNLALDCFNCLLIDHKLASIECIYKYLKVLFDKVFKNENVGTI